MSTLHERLLAELKGWHIWAPPNAALALSRQETALRAVLERHRPVPCSMPECGDPEHQLCAGCGHAISWPEGCPDTMAIAEALRLEVDGD